jgi:hypothetical protein
MTFLDGAEIGVIGSLLDQLFEINDFRARKGVWPWQDPTKALTVPFMLFGSFTKFFAAFLVVGTLVSTKQISGPWAAGIAGMVADSLARKAAKSLKGHKL